MAGIIKRGELQYEARVRIKGYPYQSATFESRADALAWAATIEAEMRNGRFVDRRIQDGMRLYDALERYRTQVTVRKHSAITENYRIEAWKRHPLALRPIGLLRGADFAKYRDDRLNAGKSSGTVRLDLALVGHLFEVCRREWGMESLANPLRNMRLPPASARRERRLRPGEEETILAAIDKVSRKPWLAAAFVLAIETALRQSVLLALRWDWIDLDAQLLRIPPQLRVKGRKGVPAALPLWAPAVATLKGLPRSDDGRVLPLTTTALRLAWDHVKRSEHGASFRDLRWHDLRHEAASRLVDRQLPTLHIQAVTGHKSVQMLSRYTHVRAEDLLAQYGLRSTTDS